MSFFKLSSGEEVKSTGEVKQDGFKLIPNNTTCEAIIVECGWASYEGKSFVNTKWQVTKPSDYANRIVFKKIYLMETGASKLDTAIKLFAAIDKNANDGKIVATGERPTNEQMFALLNKPMLINVTVWNIDGKTGNTISGVSPRSSNAPVAAAPVAEQHDADIPF